MIQFSLAPRLQYARIRRPVRISVRISRHLRHNVAVARLVSYRFPRHSSLPVLMQEIWQTWVSPQARVSYYRDLQSRDGRSPAHEPSLARQPRMVVTDKLGKIPLSFERRMNPNVRETWMIAFRWKHRFHRLWKLTMCKTWMIAFRWKQRTTWMIAFRWKQHFSLVTKVKIVRSEW